MKFETDKKGTPHCRLDTKEELVDAFAAMAVLTALSDGETAIEAERACRYLRKSIGEVMLLGSFHKHPPVLTGNQAKLIHDALDCNDSELPSVVEHDLAPTL